jgi:hypothetical protein
MITLFGYALFVHMLSFIVLTLRHTLFRGTLQPLPQGTTTIAENILAEAAASEEEPTGQPTSSEKDQPLEQADWENTAVASEEEPTGKSTSSEKDKPLEQADWGNTAAASEEEPTGKPTSSDWEQAEWVNTSEA